MTGRGALGMALWYVRLTWFLSGVSLHRLVVYRADFLIGAGSLVVRVACQLALLGIIFQQVPALAGWSYHQVLFLTGFALLPRALDRLFTDQLWILSRDLVRTGDFHRYLLRPTSPLYTLLSERFLHPDGFGELVIGLAVVATAAAQLDLTLTPVQWLLLPLLVLCGALITTSIKVVFAALSFWTTTSFAAVVAASQPGDLSGYPLDLFHPSLRRLLTWLLPYAFTAYVPVSYLLFDRSDLLLWLPLVTAATLAVAGVVWRRGVDRFEMTGS
ncbi:ABC-2 family transporter protein [Polymorphospora sp. NPDC051019]|uniref:ABC transporter permease n=1 Tax=Polymorphospora sp. NPDC051019 TaxID=3155725 RepID=UPI0034490E08